MTEAKRIAEERRARRMAELDDGGCVSAGGLYVKMQKFPPPDTSGMTPEEKEVAIAKWLDAIARWEREAEAAAQAAGPVAPPVGPTNTSSPQAPVS